MAENNYLENWKNIFSYPNHITDNTYLTEDGKASLNNKSYWDKSQEMLLLGSAVGTTASFYLNPNPLYNKIGEIYSSIVNNAFLGARTDAIKMNLQNMDYTNGRTSISIESQPNLEFFRFYEDTNTAEEIYSEENVNRLSSDLALIDRMSEKDSEGNKIISYTMTSFCKKIRFWGDEWAKYLEDLRKYLEENKLITSAGEEEYRTYYDDIYIKEEDGNQYNYIIPSVRMASLLKKIISKMFGEQTGLQLLMPQYHRRVEVEDLNKNFWVISMLLDAIVNTLWGKHSLIDVVRQLISRVNQLEDYLGLIEVNDIDIMMADSNDMYFDMYSRFELSNLQLKLKTSNGERVLKNIFKNHIKKSNRLMTTESDKTISGLFEQIQQEIDKDGTLYDSDIIRTSGPVTIGQKKGYVSLSSVIDAINNEIISGNITYKYYTYEGKETSLDEVFRIIDPNRDGVLFLSEIEKRTKDMIEDGTLLSEAQIENFGLNNSNDENTIYEDIYDLIKSRPALQMQINNYYKNRYNKDSQKNPEELCFKQINVKTLDKIEGLENIASNKTKELFLEKYNELLLRIKSYSGPGNTINNENEDDRTTDNRGEIYLKCTKENYVSVIEDMILLEKMNKFIDTPNENWDVDDLSLTLNDNTEKITLNYSIMESKQDFNLSSSVKEYNLTIRAASFISALLAQSNKEELKESLQSNYEKVYNIFSQLSDAENSSILDVRDAAGLSSYIAGKKPSLNIYRLEQDFGEEYHKSGNSNVKFSAENKEGKIIWSWGVPFSSMISKKTLTLEQVLTSFYVKKILIPTQFFFDFLKASLIQEGDKTEILIKPENAPELIKSIKTEEYGLYDNVLIFLYDSHYYEYTSKLIDNTVKTGLFLKVSDSFYNINTPFIPKDITSDNTDVSLFFVPREDLYNGEIIQLRLTERGKTKKYLNFKKLLSDNQSSAIEQSSSNLFLSLHNSFAINPLQYNTRTTLFFKNTTPEIFSSEEIAKKLNNISDWFCNGLECFYFKPVIELKEGKKVFSPYIKKENLKINASMIAKRDNYIDNSFITSEQSLGEISTSSSSEFEKYDGKCNKFLREQKYGAAIRDNLIFYSTASQNEKGQFIHSPLNMLLSERKRGQTETIQTTRLTGRAKEKTVSLLNGKGNEKLNLDEIKDILYKNSYEKSVPMNIQVFFGSRKIQEYVKWKQLKYIVFEREEGNRNESYGPTHVNVAMYDGYLHGGDTNISLLGEYNNPAKNMFLKINWVDDEGNISSNSYPPKNAKYGYVDLTKININSNDASKNFANNFMIQVFSFSGQQGEYPRDIKNHRLSDESQEQSIYENDPNVFDRRPIFKTIYLFGENEKGLGKGQHTPYS